MIEIEVAAFLTGVGLGWWLRSRQAENKRTRIYPVSISPSDTVYLRFIGTLDERKAKAVANHVLDGGKFTGLALERRNNEKNGGTGFLSPSEFKGVRDDLIERGFAWRKASNQPATLLPPAYALFRHIAGRRGKQATSNNIFSN